ncbi:penicillin binding protein PBP4B [Treponema phagedenis]|uniref:Penicillin binding protein PBP4B n=1 Tax=Treponema phagedenis TaxID=162 RepID=A0AAE6IUK6_TREPH|nr:penicillin binding protein PBP4B [Treponema phagedenis]QEJ98542.1 penicillin binding protein PBP4B [Treponema phagedenis]QEK04047.1 penicillin binding protein PBP4B [Treponema phagedenis]QEK09664.1 penicillin binding protein PBP4B [Treponema phagedenis]
MKKNVIFVLSILLTACASSPKIIVSPTTAPRFLSEQHEAEFQVDTVFPIDFSNYDDSILTNNFISFIGFSEQGKLYFTAKGIKNFNLYVNGYNINTKKICDQENTCIDISTITKNGKNILYIGNIQIVKKGDQKTETKPFLKLQIPYPEIIYKPTNIGTVDYRAFQLVDSIINAEVQNGFPGAQLVIVKDGKLLKSSSYGNISTVDIFGKPVKKPIPVTNSTLFDLASNTKIYAANFALQKLIYEQKISIHDRVVSFFPEFVDSKKAKFTGKKYITIHDLLTHQAGFPAGARYFAKISKPLTKTIRKKNSKGKIRYVTVVSDEVLSPRERTFRLIMETPLVYKPGTQVLYSDIDYLLLTFIIEKITKMPLDEYVTKNFYKPLNLNSICFEPLKHNFMLDEIAATAITGNTASSTDENKNLRRFFIHGTVHDEEAFHSMEQVSGHAGLFANAESLAVLAQVMLNRGGYGTIKLFDENTVSLFASQSYISPSYGLGWRRQGAQNYAWAFSPLADSNTVGHTGWTGTLTVIDPKKNLIIILLTNAKNTPYPDKKRSAVKTEGDYYLAKCYGAITTILYNAFENTDKDFFDFMLIELVEKKYAMLKAIKNFNNSGYIKDLRALMDTVKSSAKHSSKLRAFLKSPTGKAIEKKLESIK